MGRTINTSNPVREAAAKIVDGEIVAIHGIGGTHLATRTSEIDPILELRRRKRRPQQPFAIMVRDLSALNELGHLSKIERDTISSWRKPIVLIDKRHVSGVLQEDIIEAISPGLTTIGVMLPYSGVHIRLFDETKEHALVMTSANPSGHPMYITPREIVNGLSGIADAFLVHNRRIVQRVDDSVLKMVTGNMQFLRRARGYVPSPIELSGVSENTTIIAVGPEKKSTGTLAKGRSAYMTQHIGNSSRAESLAFLEDAIRHLGKLIDIGAPSAIACDLHPEFLSTLFAKELSTQYGCGLVQVQHHHAHMVSLQVDAGIDVHTRIVCITADGYGYGPHGEGWGGEILVGNANDFANVGGLDTHLLPGGDLTARYPIRVVVGLLDQPDLTEYFHIFKGVPLSPNTVASLETLEMLELAIKKRINTLQSSSMGRFLDAVALVLGICSENTYEGECPMKLESVARDTGLKLPLHVKSVQGRTTIDTRNALSTIVQLREKGHSREALAFAIQFSLGEALASIAIDAALEEGTDFVGLTGGAAVNHIIAQAIRQKVAKAGLKYISHSRVPPGDGGVSLGQAAIAAAQLSN